MRARDPIPHRAILHRAWRRRKGGSECPRERRRVRRADRGRGLVCDAPRTLRVLACFPPHADGDDGRLAPAHVHHLGAVADRPLQRRLCAAARPQAPGRDGASHRGGLVGDLERPRTHRRRCLCGTLHPDGRRLLRHETQRLSRGNAFRLLLHAGAGRGRLRRGFLLRLHRDDRPGRRRDPAARERGRGAGRPRRDGRGLPPARPRFPCPPHQRRGPAPRWAPLRGDPRPSPPRRVAGCRADADLAALPPRHGGAGLGRTHLPPYLDAAGHLDRGAGLPVGKRPLGLLPRHQRAQGVRRGPARA